MKSSIILFITLFSLISTKEKEITFDKLLKKLQASSDMQTIAIAGSDNIEALKTVRDAKDLRIANSILVGDEKKTREMAKKEGINIDDFELINVIDPDECALTAVKLVHDGKADMFMKGSLETKEFLKASLNKKVGLRTGKPLSLVGVFEIEGIPKMVFLTDPAVMPHPTLDEKIKLINNAVDIAKACGIETPKVAPIACVEVVNPKIPETVEARQLTEMNDRGEIKDCIIDGPLSLDLAIDPRAAVLKKIFTRKIQGDADIILFPDIHSANAVYKAFMHTSICKAGTIVSGTTKPMILTSRADTHEVKINSIILGGIFSQYLKGKSK